MRGLPTITGDEFEQQYAARSGVTVEWLRAAGRVVAPCPCDDDPACQGWQSLSKDLYESLKRDLPHLVTHGRIEGAGGKK